MGSELAGESFQNVRIHELPSLGQRSPGTHLRASVYLAFVGWPVHSGVSAAPASIIGPPPTPTPRQIWCGDWKCCKAAPLFLIGSCLLPGALIWSRCICFFLWLEVSGEDNNQGSLSSFIKVKVTYHLVRFCEALNHVSHSTKYSFPFGSHLLYVSRS